MKARTLAAIVPALLLLGACNGGNGPTAPPAPSQETSYWNTEISVLSVNTYGVGCPGIATAGTVERATIMITRYGNGRLRLERAIDNPDFGYFTASYSGPFTTGQFHAFGTAFGGSGPGNCSEFAYSELSLTFSADGSHFEATEESLYAPSMNDVYSDLGTVERSRWTGTLD